MSYSARVIRFISETQWPALPPEVKHQAKRCMLDALGALLAGTRTPVARLMADFARAQLSGNQATILGTASRASLVGAALANGFAGNALDVDDGYRLIKGHPGACVLPAVLAAGEAADCAGADLLTALVIGYEVGIRAGLIRHATSATYHSSGSWGAIAGAAAAGRLLGLDAGRLEQALGTAEYHAPIAPMMKGIATPSMGKDSIGWGCLVALSSVLLAQRGFTGVRPLFDDTPNAHWVSDLGETFEIMNLYFKPYCACRWAQPAVDGALKICREAGLATSDIRCIEVHTFGEAAALSRSYPANTEEAQYNMAFPVAAALVDGEVGPRQVLPPRLFDRDVLAMMDRVTVVAEERFQREFPAKALAEVTITAQDGRSFSSGVLSARWDPASALPTDDELCAKFRWLAAPVLVLSEVKGVGEEKARQIESLVWRLEEHRANELMRLTM